MKKILLFTVIILIACSSVYVEAQEPSRPGWRGANLKATVAYFDTAFVDFVADTLAVTIADIDTVYSNKGAFAVKDSLYVADVGSINGDGTGHELTIAYDEPNEWHLFSNNQYGLILSADWREPMREYFNDRYANLELYKIATHNQGVIN